MHIPWGLIEANPIILPMKKTELKENSMCCSRSLFSQCGGLVAKLCPSLVTPLDCSPRGSSVHGISEARIPFSHAAAKLLQLCPTLCDPIDGSPPDSLIPGILQARTLEWVAISFSNAWKWKVKSESEVAQSCPTLSNPMNCRLLHPWDFPGKSTGVGCHCLLCTEV